MRQVVARNRQRAWWSPRSVRQNTSAMKKVGEVLRYVGGRERRSTPKLLGDTRMCVGAESGTIAERTRGKQVDNVSFQWSSCRKGGCRDAGEVGSVITETHLELDFTFSRLRWTRKVKNKKNIRGKSRPNPGPRPHQGPNLDLIRHQIRDTFQVRKVKYHFQCLTLRFSHRSFLEHRKTNIKLSPGTARADRLRVRNTLLFDTRTRTGTERTF